MKVAIIGTGNMGAGLATELAAAKFEVVIGSRDPRQSSRAGRENRFKRARRRDCGGGQARRYRHSGLAVWCHCRGASHCRRPIRKDTGRYHQPDQRRLQEPFDRPYHVGRRGNPGAGADRQGRESLQYDLCAASVCRSPQGADAASLCRRRRRGCQG
jgi:hypothetical protein